MNNLLLPFYGNTTSNLYKPMFSGAMVRSSGTKTVIQAPTQSHHSISEQFPASQTVIKDTFDAVEPWTKLWTWETDQLAIKELALRRAALEGLPEDSARRAERKTRKLKCFSNAVSLKASELYPQPRRDAWYEENSKWDKEKYLKFSEELRSAVEACRAELPPAEIMNYKEKLKQDKAVKVSQRKADRAKPAIRYYA